MQAHNQLFVDASQASSRLHARNQGFALQAPAKATSSSSLTTPWQTGGGVSLSLSPFDDAKTFKKEVSDVLWCGQKASDVVGKQSLVPCSDCPIGYKVGAHGSTPLMCRDPPLPDKKGTCADCRLSALHPWAVGSCDSCITYGINPANGACTCDEF